MVYTGIEGLIFYRTIDVGRKNSLSMYDRHNFIYLYGFIDEHVHIIKEKGVKKEIVNILFPHVHVNNAHALLV